MNKFFPFLLILFCSACAIGPNYKRNEFFSDEQIAQNLKITNSTGKIVPADWFKFLEDEKLDRLIKNALKNSPNINIAKEKLKQARYNLYMTNADLLPSFDINGEYVKSNPSKFSDLATKQDYYQLGLDASWEIDIWGGKRRLSESAMAMLDSVSADFDNVKTVLISEISIAYLNWRLYQQLAKETLINIANQEHIFDTIKNKYNAGLVDTLVYNQAESLLKSTKQQLPQFLMNENKYLNVLSVLTGELASDIKDEKSDILNKSFSFDKAALYDLPVNIIRNRPDVTASEQQLVAQNALIGNKISNLLPALSLEAFLGYQNSTLSPIFNKDFNMYSNSIETIMPIFHWGKIINDIRAQKSVTKEALNNYKIAVLQAIADVSNSIKNVEESIENYTLAKDNSALYQNIAELSNTKYTQGLIAFSDFLDAEKDKISAQIQKHQALNDLLIQVIYFYKAIGGETRTNYSAQGDRKDCST